MDPTMYAAIVANQVNEYVSELERERELRRRYGPGRIQRTWSWLIQNRRRAKAEPARCCETTVEAC